MKMLNSIIALVMVGLLLNNCSDSKTSTEPEDKVSENSTELAKLLPLNLGDSFTYSVDTLDTSTNNFNNIGTREVAVTDIINDGEYNAYLCSENYELLGQALLSQSRFRVTKDAIEFYADTTGVASLIPDSVKIDINLTNDKYISIIKYPYSLDNEWQVYSVKVNFGTFKFNVLNMTGMYQGKEDLEIAGVNKALTAEKFKYKISLNIPDLENPFISNLQEFDAYLWLVPELGIVKIEGCSMILNPISGRGFNLADTNGVSRYTLANY